jgi:hypothetical protein
MTAAQACVRLRSWLVYVRRVLDFRPRHPGRIFMTGGRARTASPRTYAVDPDEWPDARITGEPAAEVVQTIARSLAAALESRPDLSLRALAASSRVGRQTIGDLLAGATWPDVLTVCRLEGALGQTLWPGSNVNDIGHD